MKLKLFKKYFFTTAIIIVFSLAAMLMILSFVLNNYIAKTKQDTLLVACNEISEHISSSNKEKSNDAEQFFSLLTTVSEVADADIFIADANDEVLVCGCDEWRQERKCTHSSARISKQSDSFFENNGSWLGTLGIFKNPHYIACAELHLSDGSAFGTVYATASISVVKELLSRISQLYLFSAVLPIIMMFFAIYAMTYRLTKPLKLMSEASKAMAKGDFSKRIPVTSDDEIGELAVSFNMMTNSLSQLEGMRKSFVANISHELKTPMTTISGFIDGILDGTIDAQRQAYYLNIVSEEVKRLSRLVQSMLSMARMESGEFALKPELFDLREMLFGIVISQEQRIEGKKIDIIGLDELQGVSVNADKDLIHQAIYNLVDNAVKFTDEKGKISFTLKTTNKQAVFCVMNTGKGIPQKDLPFVFERFYKVDKSRSASKNSTGLGLYIVKTIITAHGGTITVSSKENGFTSFEFTLPIDKI